VTILENLKRAYKHAQMLPQLVGGYREYVIMVTRSAAEQILDAVLELQKEEQQEIPESIKDIWSLRLLPAETLQGKMWRIVPRYRDHYGSFVYDYRSLEEG
jgi:hypothetical protein